MTGSVVARNGGETMRRVMLLSALLACGVSTQEAQRELPLPTKGDPFTVALAVLTQFGYVVKNTDRAAGFIRAERRQPRTLDLALEWGLTITIVGEGGTKRIVLQPENLGGRRTVYEGRVQPAQQAQTDSIGAAIIARLQASP